MLHVHHCDNPVERRTSGGAEVASPRLLPQLVSAGHAASAAAPQANVSAAAGAPAGIRTAGARLGRHSSAAVYPSPNSVHPSLRQRQQQQQQVQPPRESATGGHPPPLAAPAGGSQSFPSGSTPSASPTPLGFPPLGSPNPWQDSCSAPSTGSRVRSATASPRYDWPATPAAAPPHEWPLQAPAGPHPAGAPPSRPLLPAGRARPLRRQPSDPSSAAIVLRPAAARLHPMAVAGAAGRGQAGAPMAQAPGPFVAVWGSEDPSSLVLSAPCIPPSGIAATGGPWAPSIASPTALSSAAGLLVLRPRAAPPAAAALAGSPQAPFQGHAPVRSAGGGGPAGWAGPATAPAWQAVQPNEPPAYKRNPNLQAASQRLSDPTLMHSEPRQQAPSTNLKPTPTPTCTSMPTPTPTPTHTPANTRPSTPSPRPGGVGSPPSARPRQLQTRPSIHRGVPLGSSPLGSPVGSPEEKMRLRRSAGGLAMRSQSEASPEAQPRAPLLAGRRGERPCGLSRTVSAAAQAAAAAGGLAQEQEDWGRSGGVPAPTPAAQAASPRASGPVRRGAGGSSGKQPRAARGAAGAGQDGAAAPAAAHDSPAGTAGEGSVAASLPSPPASHPSQKVPPAAGGSGARSRVLRRGSSAQEGRELQRGGRAPELLGQAQGRGEEPVLPQQAETAAVLLQGSLPVVFNELKVGGAGCPSGNPSEGPAAPALSSSTRLNTGMAASAGSRRGSAVQSSRRLKQEPKGGGASRVPNNTRGFPGSGSVLGCSDLSSAGALRAPLVVVRLVGPQRAHNSRPANGRAFLKAASNKESLGGPMAAALPRPCTSWDERRLARRAGVWKEGGAAAVPAEQAGQGSEAPALCSCLRASGAVCAVLPQTHVSRITSAPSGKLRLHGRRFVEVQVAEAPVRVAVVGGSNGAALEGGQSAEQGSARAAVLEGMQEGGEGEWLTVQLVSVHRCAEGEAVVAVRTGAGEAAEGRNDEGVAEALEYVGVAHQVWLRLFGEATPPTGAKCH